MPRRVLLCLSLFMMVLSPARALREVSDLESLVPGLSIHLSFAHDYGDMLHSVTFRQIEYKPTEASEKLLPILDWKNREDRDRLAAAWVQVFGLHGSEVLEEGDRRLPEGAAGPVAEWLPDDTFRYTAWVAVMTGRNPGRLAHQRVEIGPDGKLTVTRLDFDELP